MDKGLLGWIIFDSVIGLAWLIIIIGSIASRKGW